MHQDCVFCGKCRSTEAATVSTELIAVKRGLRVDMYAVTILQAPSLVIVLDIEMVHQGLTPVHPPVGQDAEPTKFNFTRADEAGYLTVA